MKRTIIKIDEAKCNGCGGCVKGCHEGALQLIDGKAVMISDLYCDGLGACIGECPVGAITLEEREAEPYSEEAVMERIVPKGEAVILAHLRHLKEHGEKELVHQGLDYLERHQIEIDLSSLKPTQQAEPLACGCPGSMAREIKRPVITGMAPAGYTPTACVSELRQFPVQLHLINPAAGFFRNAHLLLAADCTAFASGDFHSRFLRNRMLAIACPKLDSNTQSYVEKLKAMIDEARIETLTVLVMEVPCCGGLVKIAQLAREQAEQHIPIKVIVLSVQGEVKSEQWI
ncbi:4Fe-4S dicluster domain-containing protein [Parabacteroides sp. PF5-6]|uniref:ATP-binding protein n=1 Tax=Parabacteroides sp. PF5-6 TaxID=1742403 RepID=UPI002405154D|nr:4Fe-4S dicluster domain-containing protein [Parabacteroides sp. PF5-6]MDF9828986.1 ferredoxin [Parabacteroides sp. PF5-6]